MHLKAIVEKEKRSKGCHSVDSFVHEAKSDICRDSFANRRCEILGHCAVYFRLYMV